jgi:hypothetical protein
MQKKCRFENKLVKPGNWTGQEFTFSPTVAPVNFFIKKSSTKNAFVLEIVCYEIKISRSWDFEKLDPK